MIHFVFWCGNLTGSRCAPARFSCSTLPQKHFAIHRICSIFTIWAFRPLATKTLGAQTKTKLEAGTRVIQALNGAPHFLPTAATDDSVALARSPTLSLGFTNAIHWLLYVLAVPPCFLSCVCLQGFMPSVCFFCFFSSVVSALVAAFQRSLLVWHLHLIFFTAFMWTKAIVHVMPCLSFLKQNFSEVFRSLCGHDLSRLKRWTSGPNSRSFKL